MKFSTKTRYGIRTMLEIATNGKESGILQKDIAENQDISYKYLDQIINGLKVAGLITKVAGRKSGYILSRKPEEITVFDIHNAFEPGICVVDCTSGSFSCDRRGRCALEGFWGRLNNNVVEYFKSVSLDNLMKEQVKLEETLS